MSEALYNLDLVDFADDASDELIGDESYAQEESFAESSKRKLTLPWWWDRHQTNGIIVSCTTGASTQLGATNGCARRLRTRKLTNSYWRKSVVRGLGADDELRSEAARRAARAQIKNRETYIDSGQVEDDLLLTKRRFISYMGFWEGYGSDTASESLERRLQCSDNNHENERGEKQIRTQDNARIRKVTGKRTTTAAIKSSRRGRDCEAPEESAEAASRVETEGADVTEAKTFEMATTSIVIDEDGIAQVAMNVGHFSVAAHHGIAWVVVSLQSNMVNCCRLLGHVSSERL